MHSPTRSPIAYRAGLLAGLAAVLLSFASPAAGPAPGPGARRFPNVELVTHQGRKVRFYDDVLKGKVVLVNFMYTSCEGGCVPSTQSLKKVYEQLGDRVGREVFFYSITLDPTNDTPAELRDYIELHELAPGWTFLTGTKENVEQVRRALGFVDRDPQVDARKSEHAGLALVGSEQLDRWLKCPSLGSPKILLQAIDRLQPDYFDRPRRVVH